MRVVVGWLLVAAMQLMPMLAAAQGSADERSFNADESTEIPLLRYGADGGQVLLWLPSESGLLEQERALAEQLAARGIEVWLADLHLAYFLPTVESSFERMPPEHVAALIQHVRQETGRSVVVVGPGRAAVLALSGARAWQLRHAEESPLGGVLLISPKLFVQTPEPGLEGDLLPVAHASDLPIFILQPAKSIWRWKLDRIIPALGEAGSDVYAQLLPEVRDRFYYRPDAVDAEAAMAERLPDIIANALPKLALVADRPRSPAAELAQTKRSLEGRTDRRLRPYKGEPTPPELRLQDLEGSVHDLKDYRGEVVLVNFWATWCPPCVHEMPSMQRLKERLAGEPFRILAVDMAEDQVTVEDFLERMVDVDFTILMDTDGAALGRWKVFAFPTTYVVDKAGRIRYALFGAIDWDDDDVVAKVEGLVAE